MTGLPVVRRELLAVSRRPSTFWVRLGAGATAIVLGCLTFLAMFHAPPQMLGGTLFQTLAVFLVIYCLLAGLLLTTDTLSSEKREGTLGLLFLTDLRGHDVVLGKMAASSLAASYGLLTVFPILAVCFVLGGVDPRLFTRVLAAAFNLLFFSLSAGMLASALCQSVWRAFGLAVVVIGGTHLLPPLLAAFLNYKYGPTQFEDDLQLFCPCFSCVAAFDFKRTLLDPRFATSLAIVHCYAWVCLLISFRVVPRSWQHREAPKKRPWLATLFRRFIDGEPAANKAWRNARLDLNPYAWVAGRRPHLDRLAGLLILVWAVVWVFIWSRDSFSPNIAPPMIILCMVSIQYPFKIWIAGSACHRLVEDHRSGAFELLLSTPLKPGTILAGQRLALLAQFGAPLLALLVIEFFLFLLALNLGPILGPAQNSGTDLALFGAANIIVAGVDIWALVWIGMAHSFTAKNAARAAAWSVAKVIPFPWFCLWPLFMILAAMLPSWVLSLAANHEEAAYIIFVSAVFIVNDLFWGLLAKERLRRDFHRAAIAGAGPAPKPWRRPQPPVGASATLPQSGIDDEPPRPDKLFP